jgi:hypothetical protein
MVESEWEGENNRPADGCIVQAIIFCFIILDMGRLHVIVTASDGNDDEAKTAKSHGAH